MNVNILANSKENFDKCLEIANMFGDDAKRRIRLIEYGYTYIFVYINMSGISSYHISKDIQIVMQQAIYSDNQSIVKLYGKYNSYGSVCYVFEDANNVSIVFNQ